MINTHKDIKVKQGIIPEFIPGSSTLAVTQQARPLQAWKALKPINNETPYKGRPELKAAFQGLFSFTRARGLTLIELLVVVMIVAILAAISTPYYTKVKEKFRAVQAITMLKPLAEAQKRYYLFHDEHTLNFDDLDVDVLWPKGTPAHTTFYGSNQLQDIRSHELWDIGMTQIRGITYIAILRRSGEYVGGRRVVGFVATIDREVIQLYCYEQGYGPDAKRTGYCTELFKGKNPSGTSSGSFFKLEM